MVRRDSMPRRTLIPAILFLATSTSSPTAYAATCGLQARDAAVPSPQCSSCGKETYGTSIDWSGTPAEAAKKAREEEKLVFVLHVSGRFEDPRFT